MTSTKGKRINARLTPALAGRFAQLRERTRKSTSQIVKESIQLYYELNNQQAATPQEIFARVGFIGCADGPRNLSRDYKKELVASLGKKA